MNNLFMRKEPDLDDFLQTEDLDDLLKVKLRLKPLGEKDVKRVRSIIQKWDNPQAVSNLLFYPSLIPADIRIDCLLRGLRGRENPYYILATIVGLQDIDTTGISREKEKEIKDDLIFILKACVGVISARASVTVHNFLSYKDAPIMFELLDHPEKAVRHNTLCWLIRIMEGSSPEEFTSMLNSSNISQEVKNEVTEKFQVHIKHKEAGEISKFENYGFAYIPNLRDVIY